MIANFYKNTSDVRVLDKNIIPIAISTTREKVTKDYFENYAVHDPKATASTYHRWYPPYSIVSPHTTGDL